MKKKGLFHLEEKNSKDTFSTSNETKTRQAPFKPSPTPPISSYQVFDDLNILYGSVDNKQTFLFAKAVQDKDYKTFAHLPGNIKSINFLPPAEIIFISEIDEKGRGKKIIKYISKPK